MPSSHAATCPAPPDPRDALSAAIDDALARVLPALDAPPAHRAVLRGALLTLVAALDRRAPALPLAAAERALAPLEFAAARPGAAAAPALAALRGLLDRAAVLGRDAAGPGPLRC